MDEAGCPKCITVDHQTLEDGTVTVRMRDLAADASWQNGLNADAVAG